MYQHGMSDSGRGLKVGLLAIGQAEMRLVPEAPGWLVCGDRVGGRQCPHMECSWEAPVVWGLMYPACIWPREKPMVGHLRMWEDTGEHTHP